MRLLSRAIHLKCVKCGIFSSCILTTLALVVHFAGLVGNDILETERLSINNTLITFHLSNRWGMGNEMFALASTYGIMRSNTDRLLCIDGNTFIRRVFHLEKIPKCSASHLLQHLHAQDHQEGAYAVYDPTLLSLSPGRHAVVGRFLQSWRYFDGREREIRRMFTFKTKLLIQAREVLSHSVKSLDVCRGCSSEIIKIGLHVRRGNMVEDAMLLEKGYKVADESYLDRAIGYYKERFPDKRLIFVVCSDDVDWCRGALRNRSDVAFVETGLAELDMAVLSLCDHNIITVGSFGWWAAWLANGSTVYYRDWPRRDSLLAITTRHEDYFLSSWIGL